MTIKEGLQAGRLGTPENVFADTNPTKQPLAVSTVGRLVWGWPEILQAVPICRRTIEREISAGRFPKPVVHCGRRPFWRPEDVRAWAEGGGK
jgi:predicted DNA-binding transcriptional regulator AlpA